MIIMHAITLGVSKSQVMHSTLFQGMFAGTAIIGVIFVLCCFGPCVLCQGRRIHLIFKLDKNLNKV